MVPVYKHRHSPQLVLKFCAVQEVHLNCQHTFKNIIFICVRFLNTVGYLLNDCQLNLNEFVLYAITLLLCCFRKTVQLL